MVINIPFEKKIEKHRKKLHELTIQSPLSSPEVVQASVKLDILLNKYELLKKKNSKR